MFDIKKSFIPNVRRLNVDFSAANNQLSKSKSPDYIREKIPAFKPKKLEEIFHESKCKKSQEIFHKKSGTHHHQIPKEQQKIQKVEKKGEKGKNSLEDFIKQSGHDMQIQSFEFQNSQLDDEFENMPEFQVPHAKKIQKYNFKVYTPQCQTFSMRKQVNPFACQDDQSFFPSQEKKQKKFWNGEITLTTSMCEDDFQNDELTGNIQIPDDLKVFIDQKCYYVQCIDNKTKNEFLLETGEPLELEDLYNKLIENERKKYKIRQGSELMVVKLKPLNEDFFCQQQYDKFKEQLRQKIVKKQKFIQVVYQVIKQG